MSKVNSKAKSIKKKEETPDQRSKFFSRGHLARGAGAYAGASLWANNAPHAVFRPNLRRLDRQVSSIAMGERPIRSYPGGVMVNNPKGTILGGGAYDPVTNIAHLSRTRRGGRLSARERYVLGHELAHKKMLNKLGRNTLKGRFAASAIKNYGNIAGVGIGTVGASFARTEKGAKRAAVIGTLGTIPMVADETAATVRSLAREYRKHGRISPRVAGFAARGLGSYGAIAATPAMAYGVRKAYNKGKKAYLARRNKLKEAIIEAAISEAVSDKRKKDPKRFDRAARGAVALSLGGSAGHLAGNIADRVAFDREIDALLTRRGQGAERRIANARRSAKWGRRAGTASFVGSGALLAYALKKHLDARKNGKMLSKPGK